MSLNREEVRRQVRAALLAEIQPAAAPQQPPAQPTGIVTEADIERRVRDGQPLDFPAGTRFTDLARDTFERLRSAARNSSSAAATGNPNQGPRDAIALGSDHGGFALKETLRSYLAERGFQILDCGTKDTSSCDYPVFARRVAFAVRDGQAQAGIVVDGAGIGSAMVVNKVAGVRAAHCHTIVEARNAREHNHAHVLTLGSGIVGENLAKAVVDAFLATPFGEGRHARRVAMIESPTAEELAQ